MTRLLTSVVSLALCYVQYRDNWVVFRAALSESGRSVAIVTNPERVSLNVQNTLPQTSTVCSHFSGKKCPKCLPAVTVICRRPIKPHTN